MTHRVIVIQVIPSADGVGVGDPSPESQKVHHKLFRLSPTFIFLLSIFICQSSHTVSLVRGGSADQGIWGADHICRQPKRNRNWNWNPGSAPANDSAIQTDRQPHFGHECRSNVFGLLFYNFKYANNGQKPLRPRVPSPEMKKKPHPTWATCMPNLCAYFSGDYHCHTPATKSRISHDLWLFSGVQLRSDAVVALA